MKWIALIALILLPSPAHHDDPAALENIIIISAVSQYQVHEQIYKHKTRRNKHEKLSTLQMELAAEMVRQARWVDRTLPRWYAE